MKWSIILFLSGLFFSSSKLYAGDYSENLRDSIIQFAQKQIGISYQYGGSSPKGFDCSGFVHYVFKRFNIPTPRTSGGYKNEGIETALKSCRKGDVILFTGTDSNVKTIGHVGIILENKDGEINFIHSSSSKKHYGVTVTRYNNSGYVKRFIKVINILT